MKQLLIFTTYLLLLISMACGRENFAPGLQSIPGFVPDSILLNNNYSIKDSMLADFDNDGAADLSITGYKYLLGASGLASAFFIRLNTLNPNYAILSEIQNDTLCNDTTMSGNQVMTSYVHNCSSPNGNVITGTYAISGTSYVTPPAGIYNTGMMTIHDYRHQGSLMGYPTYTYGILLGNSYYDGYFFIKHVTSNKIYALSLKYIYPYIYKMEHIISL